MKKFIFLLPFIFILVILYPSSRAEAAQITITGGDHSSSGGGEGEGMRINTSRPVWKILQPKSSSLRLNDLRNPKTIPAGNAVAYLSAPSFIGYMVKNSSLLNLEKLRTVTDRDIIEDKTLKISIGANQFVVYQFTKIDPIYGLRRYQGSILLEKEFVKESNGYSVYKSDSGKWYRGLTVNDVWTSWRSSSYPSSGIPLSTWSNMDWSAYPLSKYASMSIWRALKGIPGDDVLPSGTPTIDRNA